MSLSIILPFYKRADAFAFALKQNAPYFADRQVVVAMDEPSEESRVMDLVRSYPHIHWKVIINRQDHPWRNPAKAINVGIRQASGDYVLVLSPESLCVDDVPSNLYVEATRRASFTVGHVAHVPYSAMSIFSSTNEAAKIDMDKLFHVEQAANRHLMYGSICALRSALCEIGGYDESNTTYGADDDNVRERLKLAGYPLYFVNEARVIHPCVSRDESFRPKSGAFKDKKDYDHFRWPKQAMANDAEWGTEFREIIHGG